MRLAPKKLFIYGVSCCSPELSNVFESVYDIERLGFIKTNSLNNADIILVVGPITQNEKKILENFKRTKKIVAIGNCQIQNVDFDLASVGCPPRPETIIDTILEI